MAKYKTIELARQVGIHPNTVRLYEEIGFIAPVPRAENGYRVYSERHRYQIKIARCIFGHDWLGREIRGASLKIIKEAVKWDLDKALEFTEKYLAMIERDYVIAKETADILKRWAEQNKPLPSGKCYNRRQAADLIGVTQEVLRNWERNGLIEVPRIGENKVRTYGEGEIERLRIIYMLRQSKYSISAIFKSLQQYDNGNTKGVIRALNEPEEDDYDSWIFVGHRWIKGLEGTAEGGRQILKLIREAKEKNI